MNVQSVKINSTNRSNNYNSKSNTSFKATPMQLWNVDKRKISAEETRIVGILATFFGKLEASLPKIEVSLPQIVGLPSKFIYKLGQKNELPASIKDMVVYRRFDKGRTLSEIDEFLNVKNSIDCNGLSLGETAKKILTKLEVEEPDVITVGK